MTNTEFQNKLKEIYSSYNHIGKSERKTLNTLLYMLRMDEKVADYNIDLVDEVGNIVCIPSVKEFFVPTKYLTMYVRKVVCEEEDYGFNGLCLTVYVEE